MVVQQILGGGGKGKTQMLFQPMDRYTGGVRFANPGRSDGSRATQTATLLIVRCQFREEHLYTCHFGEDVPVPSPPMEGHWWPISATAEATDLI